MEPMVQSRRVERNQRRAALSVAIAQEKARHRRRMATLKALHEKALMVERAKHRRLLDRIKEDLR